MSLHYLYPYFIATTTKGISFTLATTRICISINFPFSFVMYICHSFQCSNELWEVHWEQFTSVSKNSSYLFTVSAVRQVSLSITHSSMAYWKFSLFSPWFTALTQAQIRSSLRIWRPMTHTFPASTISCKATNVKEVVFSIKVVRQVLCHKINEGRTMIKPWRVKIVLIPSYSLVKYMTYGHI